MLDSDQSMYLIGGHGYGGKVNSVYRLNVRSGRWLHMTEPEPLQNFSPRDKFGAWDYHDRFVALLDLEWVPKTYKCCSSSCSSRYQILSCLFSARQHAERAICYRKSVCLSVCPSVCLSVTRVDQSKTVEVRIMQFSPYSSPIPLVSTV